MTKLLREKEEIWSQNVPKIAPITEMQGEGKEFFIAIDYVRYFYHAHFIPIVGVGKERRILIGQW